MEVYIALGRSDVPLEQTTLEELEQHAAGTQESVLSALGPEDFELVYAHEFFGLSGRVTENGLLILAEHPDVRGVEIPVAGEWGIGPSSQFQAGD